MKYIATIGDNEYVIELLDDHRVLLDGKIYQVDFNALSNEPVFSLLIDGKSFEAYLYEEGDALNVLMQGRFYRAVVEDEREKRLRAASRSTVSGSEDFHLKAPMPGLVVMVPVKNGQQVEKGDVFTHCQVSPALPYLEDHRIAMMPAGIRPLTLLQHMTGRQRLSGTGI